MGMKAMLKGIRKLFLRKEDPVLEIRASEVSKEELISCFRDKRRDQYLVIDRDYHPRIYLYYNYYEECYEFFVTCRCVEVWDDEQNPWTGRLLFCEDSRKCGTEEEVHAAIQKLGEELYAVDVKKYQEYVNKHGMAYWNYGNTTFHAGEQVILKQHPFDYEDKSHRIPEFEMRPGRLVYDIHNSKPGFRFDQPIVTHSVYKDGVLVLEVTSNIKELQTVNLELIQCRESEKAELPKEA